MTKIKQNELTDSDFIQWMDIEKWSLTEAVYLLHGFVPPGSTFTSKRLLKEFPDAKKLLQYYPKPNQEESTARPEDWVFQARLDRMNVTVNWKAIFIQMIIDFFLNIHKSKPDYRRFIQVFVSDTKTSLKELAEYVLNLDETAMTDPPKEYFRVLQDMNTELGINAEDVGELPGKLVSPREFIKKCPRHYFNPASDGGLMCTRQSACLWWVDWPSKYPKLAAKLKTLDKAKRKQQTEVDYVLTEYLKATDYNGGMPGLQRHLVSKIHAEFIPANNTYIWTDPEGTPYTRSKSRLENRLSELKKEHALKN